MRRAGRLLQALCACLAILWAAPPAHARPEYVLDSGDVIEVSVYGADEFKRRTTINVDGDIAIPRLGETHAAGLTVRALRERLAASLIARDVIRAPDVSVELVEMRPFFINGDVAKSGQFPFQPDLTVRRAIAIAGGVDLVRLKVDNPMLAAAEVRSQYESLWVDFIRKQARVASLRAELDDKPGIDLKRLDEAPVAQRIIAQIAQLESDAFSARKRDADKERDYLRRTLALARKSTLQFADSNEQEIAGSRLSAESLQRFSSLNIERLALNSRILDEQRAATSQRGRQSESAARLAEAQQREEEAARKLARLDEERRTRLTSELQDAVVEAAKIQTQLQGAGEKLLYIGALKSLVSRAGASAPHVQIFRRVNGTLSWIEASEATEVDPGDIIEVAFSQRQLMSYDK